MITKADILLVRSLADKRVRMETGLFVAEGRKLVTDLEASGLRVVKTFAGKDAERASLLKTPTDIVALFEIPQHTFDPDPSRDLILTLDDVQNPGNVGTIIRLADWFGIRDIICSPATADCYNPKVIQATMGSIARVRVHYTDLVTWLSGVGSPVYGTFLEGDNVYTTPLTPNGIIVMGNEGQGISPALESLVTRKISIPRFGHDAESLNVAIATAIVCSEFRRR